ncbi:MAG: response regulator [Chloroflexi bacterium]|nr:response regulator [Chloroflexota bacterium]
MLLIEDNAGDTRLIREMILSDPRDRIDLETVETLGAGMRRLDERAFDIILLDLSLPDSHGLETLLRISAIAANTAVVVLTGIDDANLGLQAVQLGAQDYLPKTDVDSKLLRRSLRYALERHRSESIVRRSEQEYRSLINDVFNTSMVAVMILSRQFRVV